MFRLLFSLTDSTYVCCKCTGFMSAWLSVTQILKSKRTENSIWLSYFPPKPLFSMANLHLLPLIRLSFDADKIFYIYLHILSYYSKGPTPKYTLWLLFMLVYIVFSTFYLFIFSMFHFYIVDVHNVFYFTYLCICSYFCCYDSSISPCGVSKAYFLLYLILCSNIFISSP